MPHSALKYLEEPNSLHQLINCLVIHIVDNLTLVVVELSSLDHLLLADLLPEYLQHGITQLVPCVHLFTVMQGYRALLEVSLENIHGIEFLNKSLVELAVLILLLTHSLHHFKL